MVTLPIGYFSVDVVASVPGIGLLIWYKLFTANNLISPTLGVLILLLVPQLNSALIGPDYFYQSLINQSTDNNETKFFIDTTSNERICDLAIEQKTVVLIILNRT